MKFSEMPYTRADINGLREKFNASIQDIKTASSAAQQVALYYDIAAGFATAHTMISLAFARHSIDTKDEFYEAEQNYYDENMPVLNLVMVDMYKALLASPYIDQLKSELGELFFVNADLAVKGVDERIVPFMQQENKLCTQYDKLLASASIEFDGKTLNLSGLRYYMLHPDRETRKAAHAKRSEFFVQHADELDDIYDQLVKLRTQMAREMGYQDFTQLGYIRMNRNSYGPAEVARFREQVQKDLVPFVAKIHEQRRVDLGLDKLMYYDEDIFFPEGNPAPVGTPDQIFENGSKMYHDLSSETAEFFDFMQQNELFDVLTKPGKSGGGYCTEFLDYGAPFVFANFNGTSEDIDVLTHECGHAFSAYLARDIKILEYRNPTMETCEIHSMTMEFITTKYMNMFFDDADKFAKMQFASAYMFIPYGVMVDHFQHIMYQNPDLTPQQRKQEWLKLEAIYRPYMDHGDDPMYRNGMYWQRQAHIYERPFYYIDYCLAQFCALQFRKRMSHDFDSAWGKYVALLKKAGSERFDQLITQAGLDSPFEDRAVANLIQGEKV